MNERQARRAIWRAMREESKARVERHFFTLAAEKAEKCRAAAQAWWDEQNNMPSKIRRFVK